MSVRPSMQTLIDRVRRLIGDIAQAQHYFEDLEIQDILDQHQFVERNTALVPGVSFGTQGLVTFVDYYSPGITNWEEDEKLQWVDFSFITPTSADRIAGHWTMPMQTSVGVYPTLRITGKWYDPYGAAADLLEQKIAIMADTTYNASADGASLQRGGIIDNLYKLVANYRAKQIATSSKVQRTGLTTSGRGGILSIDQGGGGQY
jgi:hypothetical protein